MFDCIEVKKAIFIIFYLNYIYYFAKLFNIIEYCRTRIKNMYASGDQ